MESNDNKELPNEGILKNLFSKEGKTGRDLRSWRNLIVDTEMQTNLFYWYLALSTFFCVVIGIVIFWGMGEFIDQIFLLSEIEDDFRHVFMANWSETQWFILIFLITYIFSIAILTFVYTHRMVGPSVALKRQIKSLMDGNYEARIYLRKNDSFQEVARLLNEFAEQLEKKKKE